MVKDQFMGGLAHVHVMVTRLSSISPPPQKKRSREPEYKARNSSHAWSVASLWCNITLPLQGNACSDDNRDDESEVDVSCVSQSADDSLYLPTPVSYTHLTLPTIYSV